MTNELFDELVESIKEAGAYLRNEQPPERVTIFVETSALRPSDEAECRLFLQDYEAFHAELRANDPAEWGELERERRSFDGTLRDGLPDE
jgi:hypothetical protein